MCDPGGELGNYKFFIIIIFPNAPGTISYSLAKKHSTEI